MNRSHHILLLLLLTCQGYLHAQDPVVTSLRNNFEQHQASDYQEKIFLHVAKSFYLAGETLWFKVYDVDAATNTPAVSDIAYVELLDKSQVSVLQARVRLQQGSGTGSFALPVNIPSGNYLLRGYSSWMKNFSPALFFHQQVTIVNTLTSAVPDTFSAPSASIRFFPEGGNLVYGVASRVAFKAMDVYQHGRNCSGAVFEEGGDTVARFESTHRGMGSFDFTPLKGRRYKAMVRMAGNSITQELPEPYDEGYVMRVTNGTDRVKVLVTASAPQAAGTSTYLLVQAHHRLTGIQQAYFSGSQATFFIDAKDISDGISLMTVFNQNRVPVCERLYSLYPSNGMTIHTALSQPSFGRRKKVDLTLTSTDRSGRPVDGNLSLSVFLVDSLQPFPQNDIVSWLGLGSEINGAIEDPRYYIQDYPTAASAALDNLLLTQGWSRFKWEDILQQKNPYFEFLPETNGSLIAGRLIDKTTGRTAPPTICYLSVPAKQFTFSAGRSRPDGSIVFNTKNFTGTGDVLLQTGPADSNYRIDIINPFYDRADSWRTTPFSISPSLQGQLLQRSIDVQAENAYLREWKRRWRPSPEGNDTLPFYGLGDHGYRLDDYTRFQTTEEVMHEYIEEVRLPRESGRVHFRVRNNLFNNFFDEDPLMLIDGVPVFDAEKILAINPLKFRQIDVVARKFYTGPLISDGIVSYRTYDGDLGGYQLDPNTVAIHYEGIQLQQEFYTPGYDKSAAPSSRIPDFRNLLQWSPDIHTGKDGKTTTSFYTSDIPGTYLIFVQGITAEGQPGSAMMTFTVH
jgi:hypothetical protein